jgi:hypothetical protein
MRRDPEYRQCPPSGGVRTDEAGCCERICGSMMKPKLLLIAVADLGILGLAYGLVNARVTDSAAVSLAIAAVGVVTLFGVLATSDETTKVTTRFALTAAVSSVWFASVGALLFDSGGKGTNADQAFQSVSLVMGVVIAFHFGAQAYQAVAETKGKQTAPDPGAAGREVVAGTAKPRDVLD